MISSAKYVIFWEKNVKCEYSKQNQKNNTELWMKIEKCKAKKVL